MRKSRDVGHKYNEKGGKRREIKGYLQFVFLR